MAYDLYFPSYDQIGKMVAADLLRPLHHEYLTNIDDLWPQFKNPWYDVGSRYSVPYSVYSTGIGWRADLVDEDIAALDNPYDVFWDPQYAGNIAVIDDWHTTMAMVLLRNGIADINTGKADGPRSWSATQLLEMRDAPSPRVTITMYNDLPGGPVRRVRRCGAATRQRAVLPAQGRLGGHAALLVPRRTGAGMVDNDLMVVLAGGENPVAAHIFVNYLLDPKVAAEELLLHRLPAAAASHQPEQAGRRRVRARRTSKTAAVLPELLRRRATGCSSSPPEVDAEWHAIWQEYKAGG